MKIFYYGVEVKWNVSSTYISVKVDNVNPRKIVIIADKDAELSRGSNGKHNY